MAMYQQLGGEEIDLRRLEEECADQVEMLGMDLARAESWRGFKVRCGPRVIQYAKRLAGDDWQSHPLYQFHLDLAVQLGVLQGDMHGENTPSFLAFRSRFA